MARTVADAAILLGAMAGVDPARPGDDAAAAGDAAATTRRRSMPDGLQGRAHRRRAEAVLRLQRRRPTQLIEAAIAEMKAQGAVIVDPADIPTAAQLDDCEFEVLLYEFKADLNAYLAALGAVGAGPLARGADRVQRRARRHARCRSSARSCCCRREKKGPLTIAGLPEGAGEVPARWRGRRASTPVMTRFRLDALVAPTGSPAWTDRSRERRSLHRRELDAGGGRRLSEHHRAGRDCVYGLPVGMSFIGRAWSEATLIQLAYAYEQATQHRKPPQFLPTMSVDVSVEAPLALPDRLFIRTCAGPDEMRDGALGILDELEHHLAQA